MSKPADVQTVAAYIVTLLHNEGLFHGPAGAGARTIDVVLSRARAALMDDPLFQRLILAGSGFRRFPVPPASTESDPVLKRLLLIEQTGRDICFSVDRRLTQLIDELDAAARCTTLDEIAADAQSLNMGYEGGPAMKEPA